MKTQKKIKPLNNQNKEIFKMAKKNSSLEEMHKIKNIKVVKFDSYSYIYSNISDYYYIPPTVIYMGSNQEGGD